jgi:hypothetical protein
LAERDFSNLLKEQNMRRISCVIVLALCLNNVFVFSSRPPTAQAIPLSIQNPLTPVAIIAAANEAISKLNSLATSLTGDALIVTNTASAQISAKLEEFKTLVREEIAKPLESFSLSIQELGRQINSATERLNFILAQQQQCFFRNAENFLSGVSNITEELKRGIPLVSSGNTFTQLSIRGSRYKHCSQGRRKADN